MRGALIFIYIFSLVFGPKFGAFDISIALPILLFPFIFGLEIAVPSGYAIFGLNVVLLICYQFIVQVFNNNFDFDAIGRLLRAFIEIYLVGFLFANRSGARHGAPYVKVFVSVIALHSLLIVVFAIFPNIGLVFSTMLSADRQRAFRSPGLMAGYDIAGLLSIFGLLFMVFFDRVFESKVVRSLLIALFILACAFASRVSLAVALFICVILAVRLTFDRHVGIASKIMMIAVISAVLVMASYYLLLLMAATFSLNIVHLGSSEQEAIVSRFAQQDTGEFLWSKMLFLPGTIASFISGTGGTPKSSDVGYVREIFSFGVIGLLFSVWSHVLLVWQGWRSRDHHFGRKGGNYVLLSCATLMLTLSLKNDYFFVRGVFPAFLIVVGIVRYTNKSST